MSAMTATLLTADEYIATGDIALELGEGEELTTPLLPDFTLDLAKLFKR